MKLSPEDIVYVLPLRRSRNNCKTNRGKVVTSSDESRTDADDLLDEHIYTLLVYLPIVVHAVVTNTPVHVRVNTR